MRRFLYIIFLSFACISAVAAVGSPDQRRVDEELAAIDDLIAATERTLTAQRQTRQLLLDFQKIRGKYLEDQQNRELVVQMVKTAYLLQESIKKGYLSDTFDPDFLKELAFFSQIATKKSLPKP